MTHSAKSSALFCCLLVALTVAPISAVSLTIAPLQGPRDEQLQLSVDGRLLVWLRVRGTSISLCVLAAPFTGERSELPLLGWTPSAPRLRLSGDGRHAFWSNERGQVWHVPIEQARLGKPEKLPIKAGGFASIQCNADGSVLAVGVCGPPSGPSWTSQYTAVVTVQRYMRGWVQHDPLTPLRDGNRAQVMLLAGSGRVLVYRFDGIKQAVRNEEDDWDVSPLVFPGYDVTPEALSADGNVMLLKGCSDAERASRPGGVNQRHVWLSTCEEGNWGTPELVLRNRNANYYNLAMSPNGRWLAWIEFDRGEDGNTIRRTRLRTMRHKRKGWGKPRDVLDQTGFQQVWNTCISDRGAVAWTTCKGWKGYVREFGKKTVCLD